MAAKKTGARPPEPPGPPAVVTRKLAASAQIITFAPGVFTVDVAAQPVTPGPDGMSAPCVRLDTLRQPAATAHAFISTLSESDLIVPGGSPAFVRVSGAGTVPVLMTVYQLEGMPAPEVRVRLLGQEPPAPPAPPPPAARLAANPPAPEAAPDAPTALLVHIEGVGDRSVPFDAWGGEPGSGRAIEGFSLRADGVLPPEAIEYQAALGLEWDTPWFHPDEFCGSRGMTLPLLGLRIRVLGDAAQTHTARYWASFVGYGERGPFAQGELCACEGAAIEAVRVVIGPADAVKPVVRRRGLLGGRR